ncbi:acetate--CoA ligase family protein [Luedemannella helvata]
MTRSDSTRTFLTEWESRALLALPGPAQALTRSVTEAVDFAARYERVVAKVSGVAHKTEVDGVRLNLSVAGVRACWAELAALGDGTVIVAEQVTGSHELIIGAVRDPQFGPVVTIGFGGELTELLDDAVALLAPVEEGELERAISTLRTAPLFYGYRGHPAVDLVAIRAILDRLSAVLDEDPAVVEIDCNPVVVRNGKPCVLDALVVVEAGRA